MNKKIIISLITLVVILIIAGIIIYMQIYKEKINVSSINTNQNNNILNEDLDVESKTSTNDYIEVGQTESRGFILDNVFHSEKQGDIHFTSYYQDGYNKEKEYAIYFALPGWEGLYFQGLGANMGENYPYEAQKYNKDMIIISPQLDDWGEESANDTIALVEFFLENYNIDKSRVYISGYSGGGETLVLDVKNQEYFDNKGYSDQHAGGNSFATDENIMNWIFFKSK